MKLHDFAVLWLGRNGIDGWLVVDTRISGVLRACC